MNKKREVPHPFALESMGDLEARRFAIELENILEASHDGIFIIDGDGLILMVNSAWERISGIPRDFVLGQNVRDMIEQQFWSDSAAIKALDDKNKVTVMFTMNKGSNVGQRIMATAIPVLDEDGEISRVVCNVRDITEIVSLKNQLETIQQLNEKYAAGLAQICLHKTMFNDLKGVVACSPETKRVFEMAAQVAKVDSTVFLTGESGVGKEVITNVIHQLSHRSQGPLIKISCGAIPESLLESELFGYEDGAFTGARKQGKPGMFELADKGTLFLDEIGDISTNLQVKLLRVLQNREVMRLGGLKMIGVDVRIVAATNKDLLKMVKAGKFREDFYYRLNVVSIEIPPLRARREDIPLLAWNFLETLNQKYHLRKSFSAGVIDKFLLYDWPGNIRELENVVERMVVMTDDNELGVNHLPDSIRMYTGQDEEISYFQEPLPLKTAVERFEKDLIKNALIKYKSTRKAARSLMVDHSTIVRKMKRYNLTNWMKQD